jgi:class 3 adenylate cyclase/tetratricopeptide (TPR) repeat protein
MSEKVSEWLNGLGLGQYAATFKKNAIDWELLPDVDQDALKDIGVEATGHRLRILKAIAALRTEQSTALSPAKNQTTNESPARPSADEDINAWSRTPGERKPVTMLFSDIVGSTSLTEKLDAEDAHDLLYHATQRMCQAVEINRGTVCRFMGDGIMAMFGAPIASERHALEACRAALDMQSSINEYANELEAGHDPRIQIRVGLHSGEVVVLDVGDDPDHPEYDASGSTVPLAARMEQSAKAGTILMTEETRALAGDLIETNEQATVTVKGVSEPVVTHLLYKVVSATESSTSPARQPIVGRKSELAQFHGLLQACLESGHGQALFIRGEAGIGKTRLVEEMMRLAQESGFTCHKALILDFGAGMGQGAIPSLVRSLLGITQSSGNSERESALDQAENDGMVNHEDRVFLNDLLDLTQPLKLRSLYDAMDAQARKEGKRTALVKLLSNLAARNSVLIAVEDLHWTDSVTLDYLARLASAVAECSALILFTSRAEGDSLDTTWRASAGETPIVTWDLGPLRKEESIKLVSAFLDVDDGLAERCIERAAGNPLFLEQLLLSVEKGVSESVPDSIKSLVLSRMDQLPGEDKQALQAAAVLGQRFSLDSLRFLIGSPDYECRSLVGRHLLRPEGSLYLFAHALIKEGVYGSLIKRQRIGLHRQAAEWYSDRDPVLHAEHLDYAEDAGASDAYLVAVKEQSELYRPERALQLIHRGLEIAPVSKRFGFNYLKGELLRFLGSAPESIEAFRSASEEAGDDIERCRAWMGLAEGLELNDEHEELISVLEDAEAIAKKHFLTLELSRIYQIKGVRNFYQHEVEACLDANRKSLQYAREANSPEAEAQALSGMADAEYNRVHLISAYRYYDQCIELAREHGFSRVIAANLPLRGMMSMWQNDLESMKADSCEALDLAEKTRHVRAKMVTLLCGKDLVINGDLIEGENWLRRGVALNRRLGWDNAEVLCISGLARAAILRGDLLEGRKLAQQAVDMSRKNDSGDMYQGSALLGVLALALEDPDRRLSALAEAETFLVTGTPTYNISFYEDALESCLQMAQWDEVDRYAQVLEDNTRAEPLPRCEFFIDRGRTLAAYGRGKRNQETMLELKRLLDEAKQIGLTFQIPSLEAALEST